MSNKSKTKNHGNSGNQTNGSDQLLQSESETVPKKVSTTVSTLAKEQSVSDRAENIDAADKRNITDAADEPRVEQAVSSVKKSSVKEPSVKEPAAVTPQIKNKIVVSGKRSYAELANQLRNVLQ
jgi:hypothetical protein